MTREEMEALVRTITLEVLKELRQGHGPSSTGPADSACSCESGCGGCKSVEEVGSGSSSAQRYRGRVLTEAGLESVATNGQKVVRLRPGTIITPLARDLAADMQIELEFEQEEDPETAATSDVPPILCPTNTIAFFSGRGSLTHERLVSAAAERAGFEVHTCAAGDRNGGTVPALACARLVSEGHCCRGVIISDEIYAVLRQANRLSGVQARVCRDVERARESRRSEINLLLLSDGQIGLKMLERILEVWLSR